MYHQMLELLSKLTETIIFEKEYETKITTILDAMLKCIPADAFSLYTYQHKEQNLLFKRIYNKTLKIALDANDKPDWKPLPLFLDNGHGNTKLIATLCALTGKVIQVDDVYANKKFDFSGTKEFDKNSGYRTRNMLVLPLKYPDGNITGVLQLINKTQDGELKPFNNEDKYLAMIFASHIAISLHLARQELLGKLQKLRDEQPKAAPTPKAQIKESSENRGVCAAEYMRDEAQNIDDELGEIAELQWSWDEEVSKFIAQPKYTSTESFYRLILRYSKIVSALLEFEDMAKSLQAIAQKVAEIELDGEQKKYYFLEMMESLGDSLSQWKRTIFVDKNAKDIHYLDGTFRGFLEKIERINADNGGVLELF